MESMRKEIASKGAHKLFFLFSKMDKYKKSYLDILDLQEFLESMMLGVERRSLINYLERIFKRYGTCGKEPYFLNFAQ